MKICFYYVDENYINYLKETEINVRGFTTVPNVRYSGRSKFVYGAVLEVNNVLYYVPVSHYNKDREYNLLIKIKHRNKTEVSGSLRFNYMIPVPKMCLHQLNFKDSRCYSEQEKIKLQKEYRYCKSKLSSIQKLAQKVYNRVTSESTKPVSELSEKNIALLKNSCDFTLLEKAYWKYLSNHSETDNTNCH